MARSPKETQAKDDAPPQRHNWVTAVGSDAGRAATSAFIRAGFTDPTLVLRWSEIAGPEVARLAQPVKFTEGPGGGILTLRATPGAALFLAHEKRPLCERINAYLGRPAISRLRFVQGALAARPARQPRPKPAAAPPPGDPALTFKGSESLQNALVRLARARASQRDFLPD